MEAEFARSNWWVGICSYGSDSPDSLVCTYSRRGYWRLAQLYQAERRLKPIDFPYWELGHGDLKVVSDRVVLVAGSPARPMSLLEANLNTGNFKALRVESAEEVATGCIAVPGAVEFPTENEETAHVFFDRPPNADYVAQEGAKPPLVVMCHGGLHSTASAELNLTIQYWTSRTWRCWT